MGTLVGMGDMGTYGTWGHTWDMVDTGEYEGPVKTHGMWGT